MVAVIIPVKENGIGLHRSEFANEFAPAVRIQNQAKEIIAIMLQPDLVFHA